MYYLYSCVVTNTTLTLMLGQYNEATNNLDTKLVGLKDFLDKTKPLTIFNCANAKINGGRISAFGKDCSNASELKAAIESRGSIEIAKKADGTIVSINKMNSLSFSTPAQPSARPAAQQVIQQPVTQSESVTNSAASKEQINRMKELVDTLNKASKAYYIDNDEIMSNKKYDALSDELAKLEESTGIILPNSPTQRVGAGDAKANEAAVDTKATSVEEVKKLLDLKMTTKIKHEYPALSLDKTKELSKLSDILDNGQIGVLSMKADGLTAVLTYNSGVLTIGASRNDGITGVVYSDNIRNIDNIPGSNKDLVNGQNITHNGINYPLLASFPSKLVVRGEVLMPYSAFNSIVSSANGEDFKNPRNLAAGTAKQIKDPTLCKTRGLKFLAFEIGNWKELGIKTFDEELRVLTDLGFTVVPNIKNVNKANLAVAVQKLTEYCKTCDYPADGLVLRLNDLVYGESLGMTGKFPKHSIAFKWADAEVETKLINIDWTVGRSNILTPTAVFEPVDLEGSTIQRASLHNVSMMEELLGKPFVGQKIWVYKANMIIPQISKAEKITESNSNIQVPKICPQCGQPTEIRIQPDSGVKTLYCTNKNCGASTNQHIAHFVSRDAMNIMGLSEGIISKLQSLGIVNTISDLFSLDMYEDELMQIEGFGQRSVDKLLSAIETAKSVKLENFIYALGIPNVGVQTAKLIAKYCDYDLDTFRNIEYDDLLNIQGLGDTIATSVSDWLADDDNQNELDIMLSAGLNIQKTDTSNNTSVLAGKTFCCTGAVYIYKNRKCLEKSIEQKGGKLTSSVSASTSYLITNDTTSGSAKNVAAQKYGIPILTENDYYNQFGTNDSSELLK